MADHRRVFLLVRSLVCRAGGVGADRREREQPAQRFPELAEIGGVVGTLVSTLFLFVVAIINVIVLAGVYQLLRRVRRGDHYAEAELNAFLLRRSLLGSLLRSLFRLISRSGQMFPLGVLFALGFDTATEIGLIGISAAEGSTGLPIWSILIFPALFAAGMSLVDGSEGVLMVGAYGWAFREPIRKLYYNLGYHRSLGRRRGGGRRGRGVWADCGEARLCRC